MSRCLPLGPILLHGLILPHWRDCVGSWPWDFYGNIILSPSGPAESTALVVCLIHASLAPRKSCMVYLYIQPPSGVTQLFHSSTGNHLQSFQCIKHICLASTSWSLLSCERWARAVSPSTGVLLEAFTQSEVIQHDCNWCHLGPWSRSTGWEPKFPPDPGQFLCSVQFKKLLGISEEWQVWHLQLSFLYMSFQIHSWNVYSWSIPSLTIVFTTRR